MIEVDVVAGFGMNVSDLMTELSDNDYRKNELELQILEYLWNHRGRVTVDAMAEATGWTRQTIYNKWQKHGFKLSNQE